MRDIIYLRKVDSYEDVINSENKIMNLIKKGIFLYKNMFNIVTKKYIEEKKIWILPFREKVSVKKLDKIIKKQKKFIKNNTIIIPSNYLIKNQIEEILKKYEIHYLEQNNIKKILSYEILKVVNKLQNKDVKKQDITLLVNEYSQLNLNIIKEYAFKCKTIKIVSKNLYHFRKLEEELYDEYGIAIQFSSSYQKSLANANIIINLDFSEIEINEYKVNPKAIIINANQKIKIKSKLFAGVMINSCKIKFGKKLKQTFYNSKLLHKYENLILYGSIVENRDLNTINMEQMIKEDGIQIQCLIGNNGVLSKREFWDY